MKSGIKQVLSNQYLTNRLKLKLTKRLKEGHFILIKGTIHQAKIIILNINANFWCTQFHKEPTSAQTQ